MPRARAAASAASSGGADTGASSTLALTETAAATTAGSGGAASLVPAESTGMTPKLQNIVCTVTLGCPLDLKRITLHARNAEYNPKRCGQPPRPLLQRQPVPLTLASLRRFAAVIMRIRDPKTTALIFASGKVRATRGSAAACVQHTVGPSVRADVSFGDTCTLVRWLECLRSDGVHWRQT